MQNGQVAQTKAAEVTDWAGLEAELERKQNLLGMEREPDLANGPASPKSLMRLFGAKEEDVQVKLYRDHAAWCPYCQRVWLMLELKKIPYVIEKINMRCYGDKPPAFLQKVPSGLLPVLEVGGRVLTESADIMFFIEETFTDITLLPDDARLRSAASALLRLERDLFGLWCQWLFRPLDDRGEARARQRFEEGLTMVDKALASVGGCGPFFLGEHISIVDLFFVPFIERYNASLLYWKGFKLRNGSWSNIDRWFEALESMPTYCATQSDFYTHAHDIPPQYGPPYASGDESLRFAKAIDGTDGTSWRLPLPPLTAASMEQRSNVADSEAPHYRVQAAAQLISNHAAVTRFALRGVGSPGRRFSARLADPAAIPNMEFEGPVSYALALTAHALLTDTSTASASFEADVMLGPDRARHIEVGAAVVASLEYLRDRVGVPRDMQLPAARQLRAHLNWCIDATRDASSGS